MRQIGIMLACGAMMLGAVGCDDSRSGDDAGGIVLMDSGPRADSGTRVDSGGMTTFPTSCTVSAFGPLPAACLPRCQNSTIGPLNACTDTACVSSTLMADPTPGASVMGPGGTFTMECFDCFLWQLQTCWAESCPTEFNAWGMCDPMAGDCTAQENALDACLTAMSTPIGACADPRINACFATTTGFLPSFDGPRVHVTIERLDAFRQRHPDLF